MGPPLQTEPLSLKHQEIITKQWEHLCATYDLELSEYSFANAFLFRQKHQYQFVPGNFCFLLGKFDARHCYLIPICPLEKLNLDNLKKLLCKNTSLYPIPEDWLSHFEQYQPTLSFCRADSDYMYRTSKLQTLGGRVLSSRRNLLHQFENNYTIEAKDLTENEMEAAQELLNQWQKQSQQSPESTDYLACQDALTYFTQLKLRGRIIYANGLPVGFTIGELLTPQTALLHFAKSLHNVKGVTPYLYRDFALNLPETVEWVNMEQDLCIPALRQAKEAYDPDKLLTKWRVELK